MSRYDDMVPGDTFNMGDDEDPQGLNLWAKFDLAIKGLTGAIEEANNTAKRREQRRMAEIPRYVPFSHISTPGAAVFDLHDFQGPQPGRQWVVRLLAAVASPLAANAAIVSWYVGQIMPGPAAGMLPPTMLRWQFGSIPNFQNFTSDVIKILPGEHLIAGLTSVPASSIIALSAAINDQPLFSSVGKFEAS